MKMGMGIEDLERLNKLPKTIASPEMDLEKLKRMKEYIRKQWWDEIERIEGEYQSKFIREGTTNEFLEANLSMAKLKLVVSFLDNGERNPEHGFSEDEIEFLRGFEELTVIGRLSVDELVDYFARAKGKERGLVKIAFDAVNKGYNVMDEIVRRSDIPGDLANAFKRVYGERLRKMKDTAKEYIEKYGPPFVVKDISSLLEESEKERKKIIEELNQNLSNLEARLKESEGVRGEKERLEETLRSLEREVVSKEAEKEALSAKLEEFEDDKRNAWKRYEKLESAWSESIREIEERRRVLDARESELKQAAERQRAELKDTARQAFEDELRNINTLREELEKQEQELKRDRAGLDYEKRELEERSAKIKTILEGGEVKRFVTSDVAKIHEMNYIGRFEIKMNELPKRIYDPIEGKERKISSWSYHYKFDDADKILNLNTPKMDYDEAMGKLPLNPRSRYVLAEKKYKLFGKEETKLIIEASLLNHLKDYAENGFDTKSVTLSELLSVLTRYIDRAELGNYFHVLGIASVTGWDERVLDYIQSDEFHRNFVNRHVSICLVDLETGELSYNKPDSRINDFIDLFEPLFDVEKLEKCKESVKIELDRRDYVVLEDISKRGICDEIILTKGFYDLECEGFGKVVHMKDIGTVLRRD